MFHATADRQKLTAVFLTRDISTELEMRDALIRPRSFNATARTVEVIVATGSRVTRQDSRGEYDEILDVRGPDLSAFRGAPVLNGHRHEGIDNVIGTVVDARVDGEQIVATVQLSERAELAPVVRDIEAGIINQVSAGYQVAQWVDGNRSPAPARMSRADAHRSTARSASLPAAPTSRRWPTISSTARPRSIKRAWPCSIKWSHAGNSRSAPPSAPITATRPCRRARWEMRFTPA